MVIHTEHQEKTNIISLYTGSGMLDEGVKRGFKEMDLPGIRTICYVERDFNANALLVDKIQAGKMDDAPIWTDSSTLDTKIFAGKVCGIIGGFPCQPFSAAGHRKGEDDERWLWSHIKRLAIEIRPCFLFLENVSGLISGGGLPTILADLSSIGFDAEWISLRASEIGAPQQRERVFIFAIKRERKCRLFNKKWSCSNEQKYLARTRKRTLEQWKDARKQSNNEYRPSGKPEFPPFPGDAIWNSVLGKRPELAPAMDDSDYRKLGREQYRRTSVTRSSETMANTNGIPVWILGRGKKEQYSNSSRQVPRDDEGTKNKQTWQDPVDEITEQKTESEIRGMANGMERELGNLSRSQQIKIMGNGVVPQQAHAAIIILYERLMNE